MPSTKDGLCRDKHHSSIEYIDQRLMSLWIPWNGYWPYTQWMYLDIFSYWWICHPFVDILNYQMNYQTTQGEIAVFQTLFYIIFLWYFFLIIFYKFTKKGPLINIINLWYHWNGHAHWHISPKMEIQWFLNGVPMVFKLKTKGFFNGISIKNMVFQWN